MFVKEARLLFMFLEESLVIRMAVAAAAVIMQRTVVLDLFQIDLKFATKCFGRRLKKVFFLRTQFNFMFGCY